MSYCTRRALAGLLLAGLAGNVPGAASGPETKPAIAHHAKWEIRPFMSVAIVPREAGAQVDDQPMALAPEALRKALSGVTIASGRPLFDPAELALLVGPLAQALAEATAGDDLQLLSNYKREGSGFMVSPKAVTALLFLQGGRLNLIVHDDRFEFYGKWLQDRDKAPRFEFGSRARAGSAQLRSPEGTSIRPDWVTLPLAPVAVVPADAPIASSATPAPAALPTRDAAFYEQQQQRLRGLQGMRDAHAISEEEYQQKRKEILAGL